MLNNYLTACDTTTVSAISMSEIHTTMHTILCKPQHTGKLVLMKLEQLERLRSEDTRRCLMITHTIESYCIPSQKKTKSKLQYLRICQNLKFLNFETNFTPDTPEVAWYNVQIWNGSDEYCWRYRADTILSTDRQTNKVKPVYPLSTSLKREV